MADNSLFYNYDSTPSYLSDSRGRSVTPVISPLMPKATLPTNTATEATDTAEMLTQPLVRKPGRPPKLGGAAKPASSAPGGIENDPELSKLGEHQRIVGPLMERMGCVLANEERRMTFLDDEDFEDEGWGSEHDMRD
jgi:hypothetical protein